MSIILLVAFLMSFSHNTVKSIKSKIVFVENNINDADDSESDDERVKKELELDGFLDELSRINFNRYFESSLIWKTIQISYFSIIQKIIVPPPRMSAIS